MDKKNIHINNSYLIWSTNQMWSEIIHTCHIRYGSLEADKVLNRSYSGMYIEWWIHNIGYYLTLLFPHNKQMNALKERFKHVDLEEH